MNMPGYKIYISIRGYKWLYQNAEDTDRDDRKGCAGENVSDGGHGQWWGLDCDDR